MGKMGIDIGLECKCTADAASQQEAGSGPAASATSMKSREH